MESGGRISLPCDRQSSRLHWLHAALFALQAFRQAANSYGFEGGMFPVTKRWRGHGWHANEPRAGSSRRRTAQTARRRGLRGQSALVGCTLARTAPLPPTSAHCLGRMANSAHSGAISECGFGGCFGRVDDAGGLGWGAPWPHTCGRSEQVRAELEAEWEARGDVGLSIVEFDPQTQVS